MHLLVHALCGAGDEGLVVGQIAGDFVRGRDLSAYPGWLALGIRQHRQLDNFSDQHIVVRASRARLRGEWRRYAGILVDLFYGHALALNWDNHAGDVDLLGFEEQVHSALARHHEVLPMRLQRARVPMREQRILSSIGESDGIEAACNRLAHRLPPLRGAHQVVEREYQRLLDDFDAFWPSVAVYRR